MLDFLIGFAVSILSGLGIGGGGLLVIWLVLQNNVDQLTAQAINLVYFLFSSGTAMLVHLTKRKLNLRLIIFISAFGIIGAVVGSLVAKNSEPEFVRKCFGWLLIASGLIAIGQK